MKLLLNYMLAAALIIIGTMPLQAQQTNSPQQQQQSNQEVAQLIDRLDNLMDRALELDKKSDFDETRTEGVDRERDDDEGAVAQRDRSEFGETNKKDKMVQRLGEDLALSIGSLKNAAERYEQLIEEEGPNRQQTAVQREDQQEDQEDQQTEQQQRAETEDDSESMQQEMDEIHQHLVAMADELESAIETIEKINNGAQSQPGESPYDPDENDNK